MSVEQYVGWCIAVALACSGGYMLGVDHERSQQSLRKITEPAPCECLCGLTQQKLRNIVFKTAKQCERRKV